MIWENMSKARKARLIDGMHKLTGDPLRAKLCAVLFLELQRWLPISLAGTGIYLDSPVLADRYKEELPVHYQNALLENLRSIKYAYRACSDILPEKDTEESHTKTPKKANASGSGPADRRKIPPIQRRRIDKWLDFMRRIGHEVAAFKDDIIDLDRWIGPKAKYDLALIELSLDNKNHSATN